MRAQLWAPETNAYGQYCSIFKLLYSIVHYVQYTEYSIVCDNVGFDTPWVHDRGINKLTIKYKLII